MRTAAVLTVAGAAVAVLPMTSAYAARPDAATGTISWTTAGQSTQGYPGTASASFVAQQTTDGTVRGTVTVTNHDGVDFTGTVTCFEPGSSFNGNTSNTVIFGGTISASSGTDLDGQGVGSFEFVVQDNGEPGNLSAGATTPDLVTLTRSGSTAGDASPCLILGFYPKANRPLSTGNLQTYVAS